MLVNVIVSPDIEEVAKHEAQHIQISTDELRYIKTLYVCKLGDFKLSFIKNVDNLSSPTKFLNAGARVLVYIIKVLFIKYSVVIKPNDIIVTSKVNLVYAVNININYMEANARNLNLNMLTIETSLKNKLKIDNLRYDYL